MRMRRIMRLTMDPDITTLKIINTNYHGILSHKIKSQDILDIYFKKYRPYNKYLYKLHCPEDYELFEIIL